MASPATATASGPTDRWPAMRLDRRLGVGASGGHGSIRSAVPASASRGAVCDSASTLGSDIAGHHELDVDNQCWPDDASPHARCHPARRHARGVAADLPAARRSDRGRPLTGRGEGTERRRRPDGHGAGGSLTIGIPRSRFAAAAQCWPILSRFGRRPTCHRLPPVRPLGSIDAPSAGRRRSAGPG